MPIQLPALGIQAPQQPDLLGQFAKIQQLKTMAGQQQIQQQTMQENALDIKQKERDARDQQAMTSAMQEWDGKNFEELPAIVNRKGGSAKAVLGLRSSIFAQKKEASEIAKNDAETGSNRMKTMMEANDQMAGRIGSVLSLPDNQLAAGVQQAAQQSTQDGLLDPQHAQMVQGLMQLPPDQMRAQLQYVQKGYLGQKAQQEAAVQQETARHNQATEKQQEAVLENNVSEPKLALRAAQGDPDAIKAMKLLQQQKLASRPPRNDQAAADAIEAAAQSIATMNPKDLTRLKDIASMRGDQRLLIYNRAKQINPNFSTAEVDRRAKMLDSFENGKDAQQLQSFGTFLEHAGEASRITNEFRTSSIPLVNTPINAIRNKFGDESYTRFIAALEPVRKEFEGFLLGGRALYGDDRKAAETILSDSSSPAQIQGALKQMGHTVKARQNEIGQRFKNTMGAKMEDVLGPMSPEAIEGSRQIGLDMGQHGAPATQAPSSGGFSVRAPNGKTYSFKDQQSLDNFKKAASIQ